MSRYIDATFIEQAVTDAEATLGEDFLMSSAGLRAVLNSCPTADVVEVVRCKDCRRWTPTDDYGIDLHGNKLQYGECSLMQHNFREDNFCCFGITNDEFSRVISCVTQQK